MQVEFVLIKAVHIEPCDNMQLMVKFYIFIT